MNVKSIRTLRYGSRKTGKFVRCYWKEELGVDRVELELHSSVLRRNGISTLHDFVKLPGIVCPKHLRFVEIDWRRLARHLSKRPTSRRIIAGTKRRAASLRRVRQYLKKHGVTNVHRFLVPMALNKDVSRALGRWARHF